MLIAADIELLDELKACVRLSESESATWAASGDAMTGLADRVALCNG